MRRCMMVEGVRIQFEAIPSFLGLPVGDLEDLSPGNIAISGYFCDNLDRPDPGQRYLARQMRYFSRRSPSMRPPVTEALDLGDVNVFPLEPEKHLDAILLQCQRVLKTGARLVLVGGDASGLQALQAAAQAYLGMDVPIAPVTNNVQAEAFSPDQPVVLSVDLQALSPLLLSRPKRLMGHTPSELIARIKAASGEAVAAAVFGLAPALDGRGRREVEAAQAVLQAVVERLQTGGGAT